MERLKSSDIVTYAYDDDYRVDIGIEEDGDEMLGAWLYHRAYGVKMFMYGIESMGRSDFLCSVESSIDKYIELYDELFIRREELE